MAKTNSIRWTSNAKRTYLNSISFILKNWNLEEVEKFETLVHDLLNRLQKNKNLCPKSKHQNLRKCVVSAQTSLVYHSTSKTIDLIAFIDNRSLHTY